MHPPFPNPPLHGLGLLLEPLAGHHFEELYAVASDPLIWVQHPASNRYERVVFEAFFEEAIQMGGAFLICDDQTRKCIGSTRFYHWEPNKGKVVFGYTFLAREVWGNGTNLRLKRLGLAHAFCHVNQVDWEIHASNLRSKMALEKLGLKQALGEEPPNRLRFSLTRENWLTHNLYFPHSKSDVS